MSMWRKDIKCKYMFFFPLKNLARKGLTTIVPSDALMLLGARTSLSTVVIKFCGEGY